MCIYIYIYHSWILRYITHVKLPSLLNSFFSRRHSAMSGCNAIILEGSQSRGLHWYKSKNLLQLSWEDLPVELATQTEQMDADLENRKTPKDPESGPKRPPTPDWCERCKRNEPRRFCQWCQRHVCTEQCWVADSKRGRRCHECVGAGEFAGETESAKDPVRRSNGDTHVSSSCSWSGLQVVQDELPEVLEKEALSSFRFNPHAAPFSPHAITKGRTQATGKASEKADQDYVDDAADAAYTIIGVGMYGLTEICSVQDSHKTSSFPTSSALKTSFMQCSVQLPVQVQRCAVCNVTLCSDFISSWTTTCNECNRIACVIQRSATQPQTAVPSTNREPTTPPRCRYCSRIFEDEVRRCDKCRGLMCFSCNLEGAWICRTCGELEEQQDAEKIACAHCKKVHIQRNRRCSYCSQDVCEDCDHESSYIREKCPRDEQYMRRCWTRTGAASSSKDTSAMHETDEAVDRESRTTISAAIFEDSDFETDIATSITPQATSCTRALTLVLSPEETQSVANSRSSRRIIGTEWY